MRKEVVFAIIAGIAIGSVFAFGVYRANSALDKPNTNPLDQSVTSPSPAETSGSSTLVITQPLEDDLQTTETIEVKGLAQPDTYIIVSTESRDEILLSQYDGGFMTEIDLEPGLNRVLVASLDQSGSLNEKILNIVYSKSFTTDQAEETESIDESVEARVADIINRPKVIIGDVTDLTGDTIQITDNQSKVELLSIDRAVIDIVNSTEDSAKVDFEDLAIGNHVIAMGLTDQTEVMDAKRILIINKPENLDRKVFYGDVTESSRRFLNMNINDQENLSVNTSRNLIVYDGKGAEVELPDVAIGSVIITSGVLDEGELYARIIQVISSPISETDEEI